jgi:hypothetical protein
MNSTFKRNFGIVSIVFITALSTLGSATAVTVPQPDLSKGCICGGRYFPMRICMVMRCADSANSFATSDRRPLDSSLDKTPLSTVAASKNNLLAGRYRTREPGGGI